MPIVNNTSAEELPWRPQYRVWAVAGMDKTVDCTLHYSTIEPGAGAPLHTHQIDELIVVMEGRLDGRLGTQHQALPQPRALPHL